jgi:NTP pyrophosphatase (non-canonical NTP hydrolase)
MEFRRIVERAAEVRGRYAEMEQARYGRPWTTEELALGFVGDVGDLAKLIVAESGVRAVPEAREKLAHELADCLWSVIVLSLACRIDLETAFLRTMNQLDGFLDNVQPK